MDALTLDYVKRWRTSTTSNHAPLTARVEVTNDPEGEWTELGDFTFDYNKNVDYPASVAGKDTTLIGGGGEATIDFGGSKYRYIRLSVTSVLINEVTDVEKNYYTYPFWYLAELHFKSNTTPNYELVDANLRARFEGLMAQAATELEAGAAKQETIDALTAAYNEVLASIPDPIRIVNAVAEAKALRAKAQAGTEPGYFPYDAIAKFDAAIATANDEVKAGITLEEIERVLAALDAATVEFNRALILPTVDSYYVIRSASTRMQGKKPTGAGTLLVLRSLLLATLPLQLLSSPTWTTPPLLKKVQSSLPLKNSPTLFTCTTTCATSGWLKKQVKAKSSSAMSEPVCTSPKVRPRRSKTARLISLQKSLL